MPVPLGTIDLSLNPSLRSLSAHSNFFFYNIICYHFLSLPVEDAATRPHTIFSETIQILLNFLLLKFQNQEKSPFETHPKTLLFGVISFLLYSFAYDYDQRLSPPPRSTINRVIDHCMLLFGCLTTASFASLLFPDSARPAIYVLFIALSLGELLHLVYKRIRRQIIRGTHFAERRNLPFLISLWRVVAQRNQGQLLPR